MKKPGRQLFLFFLATWTISCQPELETHAVLQDFSSSVLRLEEGRSGQLEFNVFPATNIMEGTLPVVKMEPAPVGEWPEGMKVAPEEISNHFSMTDSAFRPAGDALHCSIKFNDLPSKGKYCDWIHLHVSFHDTEGNLIRLESGPITVCHAGKDMLWFSFTHRANATKTIESVMVPELTDTIIITSPYLGSSELCPEFVSNGKAVLVDGIEQESGVNIHDFKDFIHYEVISTQGKTKSYFIRVEHSGLPVLEIETPEHQEIPPQSELWIPGVSARLRDKDGTIVFDYSNCEIKGRGNSTSKFPKKPYNLKLPKPTPVLGLKEHKKWVLLANWIDRTLLRNNVAYEIARRTDLDWVPDGRPIEVILNGVHKGNYYLIEKIGIDDDRLNITEMPPTATSGADITGGYIVEIDKQMDEAFKFRSSVFNLPYTVKDPDILNPEQFAYLQSYVTEMEKTLVDEATIQSGLYRNYMDMDSFIDYMFVYELTGNHEPKNPKSVYMHKDRLGKFIAGPVWDFDWGTFRLGFTQLKIPEAVYYKYLWKDPLYKQRVKERWNLLKPRFESLPAYIQAQAELIRASEKINHDMWPIDRKVNNDEKLEFQAAVDRLTASFKKRVEDLDKIFNAL